MGPADILAIFTELKDAAPVDAGKRSYGPEHVVYPVVDIIGRKTYKVCRQSEDQPQQRFGMIRLLLGSANNRPPFVKESTTAGGARPAFILSCMGYRGTCVNL